MSAPSINRAQFFGVIGRKLLRFKITWALAALGVIALALGLADALWQVRNVLTAFVGLGFVYFGLLLAWELLPFSERTRARWAHQRDLNERYFSYRWRNLHWGGIPLLICQLWTAYAKQQVDPWAFALPVVLTVWGVLANWYWQKALAPKIEKIPS